MEALLKTRRKAILKNGLLSLKETRYLYRNPVIMNIDIAPEIIFHTARSSGKGGQHVNKVETMVTGKWAVMRSAIVTPQQKALISAKLASRITREGFLLVKSQAERTQSGNKSRVIARMNELVNQALVVKAPRIATKPSAKAQRKRLENKRRQSERKKSRQQRPFE